VNASLFSGISIDVENKMRKGGIKEEKIVKIVQKCILGNKIRKHFTTRPINICPRNAQNSFKKNQNIFQKCGRGSFQKCGRDRLFKSVGVNGLPALGD